MSAAIKPITDDDVETFDKLLDTAIDNDCLSDYVESYLRYRESGIDFVNSFKGAQEELDIEVELETTESEKEGGKE